MIFGTTEEETVRLTAEALGVSEQQARFIIALETGEIDGDTPFVEEDEEISEDES
jgi:hypothetical protein